MAAHIVRSTREMACLVDGGISEERTIVLRRAHPNAESPTVHLEGGAAHRRIDGRDEIISDNQLQDIGKQIKQKKKKKKAVAGIDQDELLDPLLLADPDSCFLEFMGVSIHHKISSAEGDQREESQCSSSRSCRLGLPMILLHGFGASVFSWRKVTKPLADLVGSSVVAFDRPAFGLTSRVDYPRKPSSASMAASTHLSPYSTAFSSLVTLSFIDKLKGSDKAILVGHSAGSLVAVDAYFEAPERVAALILVCPALIAPLFSSNSNQRDLREREDRRPENAEIGRSDRENIFCGILLFLRALRFRAQVVIVWIIKMILCLLPFFCKNLLSEFLRSYFGILVLRFIFDRFGVALIRSSWYDVGEFTEDDINGYLKPLRAKHWEKAVLEYIIALFTSKKPKKMASCKRRLSEIACPVLIFAGDHDRIVPAWNAKRLSLAMPGSHLKVMRNCGHLPHEERPEEFLAIVRTFLSTLKDV
ncbi:abhd-5-1 Abhydrolase domain-containing protein cgi-58 [Nymphaea thermarum]|nr:abhd-5-1 Abhydrolase domain-containing protein cgi-58 [Nymphaea thermarum]